MTVMQAQGGVNLEARQPWIRAALFVLALLISLALHSVLMLDIPVLPPIHPPASPMRPSLPVVMETVRPVPVEQAYEQPDTFRPENPDAFEAIEPLQKTLLADLQASTEAAPFEPSGPAEAEAPLPETRPDPLDYRQEILQIEKFTAEVELERLPRRVVPALPRVEGAPDITFPSSSEAVAAAAAFAGGSGAKVPGMSVVTQAEPPAEAVGELVKQNDPTDAERLQEQSGALDETAADITQVEPIEQILAVDVTTYRATDEDVLYFELSISRAGAEALPVLPKDVLIIQDCSESITRTKLGFFKEGILDYLRTLTIYDRINIMRYSDTPDLCFEEWAPVTEETLAQAARFTQNMRARGQTDLFTPLQQVLKHHQPGGRPMIAVLMTDGRPTMGTVASSDIIANFSRQNQGRISVFTVGAGDRVNTFLLDLLGHNNRGGAWIMPLRDEIPAAVRRTARELSQPVLAHLDYHFSGDSAAEVYPGTLTHLYLDRPLRLVGRAPLGQKNVVLQIVGDSGPIRRDMVFQLDLAGAGDGGEGIRREWVMQKIYKLINDHLASGRVEILREIRDLSIRHNVPLPYGTDFPM